MLGSRWVDQRIGALDALILGGQADSHELAGRKRRAVGFDRQ
jgi:hypothetical protein